jgi:hypothetical protein
MIKIIISILTMIALTGPLWAIAINDVSQSDAAYKAIEKSVNDGYLPLDNSQSFKPNRNISRRELAISIDKLIDEINKKNLSLSPTEVKELNHLSKSFKKAYSTNESRLSKLELSSKNSQAEFNILHTDLSKTNDDLQSNITELKKQQKYMWIAIVVSAILGLAV